MKMRGSWVLGMAALTLASGFCYAQAQNQNRDQTQNQGQASDRRAGQASATQEQNAGQGMIQLILAMNQGEIKASREAQSKLTDPQAREFAQKMIQDHTQFVQKLEQASGIMSPKSDATDARAQSRSPGQPAQTAQDRTSDSTVRQTSNPTQRQQSASGDARSSFLNAVLDMGERRCELVKKELEKKQGAEFDQCYMGQQLMAHFEALAALQTAQEVAPENARSVIAEGIQTTQKHIENAKQIAMKLDKDGGDQKPSTQQPQP
jgi:predicted outer membrane protein